MFKINEKIDGKTALLELTNQEIETAVSICEGNAMEEIFVMKKHNGAAMFFIEERNAMACQDRHKYDFMFTIKKADLKKSLKGGK